MRLKFLYSLSLSLMFSFIGFTAFGQLHFEDLVYDGLGQPLLGNPAGVGFSPEGNHVYVISYNDGAINTYNRDVDGNLTFENSVKTDINGVSGLSGAFYIMVSPEGNHVYVAGSFDNSIAVFSRNVTNGELTFVEKQTSDVNNVTGLYSVNFLELSPDGNHLYATGPDENAIVVFQRNVLTGALTFVQILQDENGDVNDMNYPVAVAASPDGNNVYVASYGDNAITVFARNHATGMLTFQEVIIDGMNGVSGISGAYSVRMTPDGNNLYAISVFDNTIVHFSRMSDGSLSFINKYQNGVNGVDGIDGINAITMSSDGLYLIATGGNVNALAVFSVNENTGALTYQTKFEDGVNGVEGMLYPFNPAFSPDMKNIFVPGFGENEFAVFDMDPMGNITFKLNETPGDMGVDGLGGASATTMSPDGKFLYVAGDSDNAVAIFEIDPNTGMMTYKNNLKEGDNGIDGLEGINGIVVSPNGKYVYTSSFWDKAIAMFSRDETTGDLTFMNSYLDGVNGITGLNGANSVAMSADGNHLYATGFWSGTMAVFNVDATTGMLTFVESFQDGMNGVDGLNRANSVTVSPDGNNVYVTGSSDDALAAFTRDPMTGMLTYMAMSKNNVNGVLNMDAPYSVAVSPDGEFVYVATNRSDALVVFSRNTVDGALTYMEAHVNGINEVTGLGGARAVDVSSDGLYVYVASSGDNAAAVFRKNVNTGSLAFEASRFDNVDGVNGLDFSYDIEVSPSGRYIYATGNGDNAVALFSCTYLVTLQESICEGDSVVVGANVYKTTGVYHNSFEVGSCVNIITLELYVQDKNVEMEASICEGDSYEFDGVEYTDAGTYTQAYTTSMGCDSIVTLTLEVVGSFEPEMIAAEICQGDKYILGSTAYDATGSYTQIILTPFGCEKTTILDLTVMPSYEEQISEVICEGELFVFGTANYTTTGTYTQYLATKNGCDSIITLNLVVVPMDGSTETTYQTICEGESFLFGDQEYSTSGTYTQTMSGDNCSADFVLELTVIPTPATTEVAAVICEGESYGWDGHSLTASGTYTAINASVSGCDSISVLTLTVEPATVHQVVNLCFGETFQFGSETLSTSGNYNYMETTAHGCMTTHSLNLTVLDELTSTPTISNDNGWNSGSIMIVVEGGMAPYTFSWSNGASTQDISNLAAGTYTVEITDHNGCEMTQTHVVELSTSTKGLENIYEVKLFPNPVGVGETTTIYIQSPEAANVLMAVYDVTGKQLQQSQLNLIAGQNTASLEAPEVAGIYIVRLIDKEGREQNFRLSVQ